MSTWWSQEVNDSAQAMLWHYANGHMALFRDEQADELVWMRLKHRGVQFLDRFEFPRREKRYIFKPSFELRFDQAFSEVVRACAAPRKGDRQILPECLIRAYEALHVQGYAHSYETWENGRLVGGAFGIQIGAYITCESMFHYVSNASKSAWGRTLLHLRDRGFRWIDTNGVSEHRVNYGEQWVPQWQFEQMMRQEMARSISLTDEIGCPPVPWSIRLGLPVCRVARGVARRLRLGAAMCFMAGQNEVIAPVLSNPLLTVI